MRWCGALIFASACVPAPAVLEAPPFGNAKTAVYTIETEGEQSLSIAVDLEKSLPLLPELPHQDGKPISLRAMHYECPADVIGLRPGVLPALGEGEGHPFPPPLDLWGSTFDGAKQSEWAPATDRPALRVNRAIECAHFSIERVIIPDTNTYTSSTSFVYPTLGVVTGPNEVTLALSDGRFYRVDPSGSQPLDLPPSTPHTDAYVAPDGKIWLYSPQGALVSGDFTNGFQSEPRNQEARGFERAWITGPFDPNAPFELYTIDDSGTLAHFDGTTWKRLARLRDEDEFGNELIFGGVEWIAPGEALAFGELTYDVVRVKNSTVSAEELFSHEGTTPSLRAIKRIPAMGVLVGSSRGRLFLNPGNEWVPLLDSPLVGRGGFNFPAVMDMAPLDEGVLFGGGNGGYSQYQPELEQSTTKYCNYRDNPPVEGVPDERFGGWHVATMLEMGCGYVLLTKQASFAADIEVDFLTRIAPP